MASVNFKRVEQRLKEAKAVMAKLKTELEAKRKKANEDYKLALILASEEIAHYEALRIAKLKAEEADHKLAVRLATELMQ